MSISFVWKILSTYSRVSRIYLTDLPDVRAPPLPKQSTIGVAIFWDFPQWYFSKMIRDFFLSSLESFGFSKVKNNGFCGSWTRPISQKIKKVRTFWIVGKWSLKGTSPEWSRIGDWGELIDAGDPQSGNRFRLRFVFVSCVRASGRGEAVWACERGVFVNAGGLHSNISCSGRGCVFSFLLLCSWVFWFFRTDCWYAHWLFDLFLFLKHGLADPPHPKKLQYVPRPLGIL